jgi:hypothetical protein
MFELESSAILLCPELVSLIIFKTQFGECLQGKFIFLISAYSWLATFI